MNADIDRLVASIAPGAGPGVTPGALEMMDEITATGPAPAARRRSWPAGLAWPSARRMRLVAGFAALAVVTGWVLPGGFGAGPAAALDVRRSGGFFVVVVKDLYADPGRYRRELASLDLRIGIRVEPASPSAVGQVFVSAEDRATARAKGTHAVPSSPDITAIEDRKVCGYWEKCTIGVRIRIGYRGTGEISLGRPARPGEQYTMPGWLAAPGEPLHCVDFVNRRKAEVVRMLREHGVRDVTFAGYRAPVPDAPDSWYVHDGVMSSAGHALLLVDPAPHPKPVDVAQKCR
ncbi:hypothetical protein Sru01_23730 [Sphaerisporangium rufum]|uniref:Uncharacterized protein n=1 Tax=Sphaerisporangium rufum TaxID=1381558 RepID=A0A919R096_9ACTN|nr:hypothetical protein [Sphaerisporangium rufum]GII77391.1 hypothetical protein Sru01_23730 [Sphaerisporangium rufum]